MEAVEGVWEKHIPQNEIDEMIVMDDDFSMIVMDDDFSSWLDFPNINQARVSNDNMNQVEISCNHRNGP
ncbi:hypothetical protein Hanom_Chr04g00377671 [Helianthus anomalus]